MASSLGNQALSLPQRGALNIRRRSWTEDVLAEQKEGGAGSCRNGSSCPGE